MKPGYSGWVGSGYSSHPVHPYPYRCSPVFQQTVVCNDSSHAVTLMQQTNCDVTNVYLKDLILTRTVWAQFSHLRTNSQVGLPVLLSCESTFVSQFGSKVVYPDSGLGYMRGQTKVWMHIYVWNMIEKGSNSTLWCDAYQETSKKSHSVPSDSDESDNEKCRHKWHTKTSADEKCKRIKGLKTKLRPKHSTAYTLGRNDWCWHSQ